MARIPCAVAGATGLAGQQFLAVLAEHPQFEVVKLAASSRSAGKRYVEAIREPSGLTKWYASGTLDRLGAIRDLVVEDAANLDARGLGVVFSAIESEPARELEPKWGAETAVVSTASAFRYEDDVPVLIPGVNLDQARLIDVQRKRRGWKGFITPNPNCTTVGLAITLAPLHEHFGVERVLMTSLQAVSAPAARPASSRSTSSTTSFRTSRKKRRRSRRRRGRSSASSSATRSSRRRSRSPAPARASRSSRVTPRARSCRSRVRPARPR